MVFLSDREIAQAQRSQNGRSPIATGVRDDGFDHKDSAVQACSLDLTVGEIYLPGTEGTNPGSETNPLFRAVLAEGATAVIRTNETLNMPANLGAFSFPPAHVSIKGLLMTNPGHVDPGYNGKMHFTVINMSRSPIEIRQYDKIVRLLLFQLSADASVPFDRRQGRSSTTPNLVNSQLLSELSPDFLNINIRAQSAARQEVKNAEFFYKIFVPIVTSIISLIGAIVLAYYTVNSVYEEKIQNLSDQITKLDGRIDGLGGNVNLKNIERRIGSIEKTQKYKK